MRTIASGVSAGTELTAYRGTNPYLTSTWDPDLRLFSAAHPDTPSYPLDGWGYSEVGEVIEVPSLERPPSSGGQATRRGGRHRLGHLGPPVGGRWCRPLPLPDISYPADVDPVVGCFVRVGAIALNAVLAADAGIGDTVIIFGQGVIGLLATHYAAMSGCTVVAVDGIAGRRDVARRMGAHHVLAPGPDTAPTIRELTGGRGADVAIELSRFLSRSARGSPRRRTGLHVVAAGFYQGGQPP